MLFPKICLNNRFNLDSLIPESFTNSANIGGVSMFERNLSFTSYNFFTSAAFSICQVASCLFSNAANNK